MVELVGIEPTDLIVANDVVLRYSALIPHGLQAKHPLRMPFYWNTIGT